MSDDPDPQSASEDDPKPPPAPPPRPDPQLITYIERHDEAPDSDTDRG